MFSLVVVISGLLAASLLLYLALNTQLYLKRRRYKAITRPPLNCGLLWFLGHLSTIGPRIKPDTSFTALMHEISVELGDEVFVLFFLNRNYLLVLDVAKPAQILTNHRVFLKMGGKKDNMAYINGTRVFGERGMVTEIGSELWYHKRKTIDGAFHRNSLTNLLGNMNDIALKLTRYLDTPEHHGSLDIYPIFNRVALETICKCGFNLDENIILNEDNLLADAFHHIFYTAQIQFQCSLKFMMPWGFREEKKALHKHVSMVRESLKIRLNDRIEQQKLGHDTIDMLDFIIRGNFYNGRLDAEDVLDDFFVFVVAGMETTAITMSLVVFYMLKHPDIFARVRQEVDAVFGEKETLAMSDASQLVYLEQCIKETLRIHPPAQATIRVNWNEDAHVDGLMIPQGTYTIMSQEVVQRRADIWPEPMKFDPDRFGKDAPKLAPFTYMPFMAGPRSCVGRHFAMLELKIMLSRIIRDFKFVDPQPELTEIPMKTVLTAKPRDGVRVGLVRRA